MLPSLAEFDGRFGTLFTSEEDNSGQNGGNKPSSIRREFFEYWGWYATVDEITMGQPWLEDEIFEWSITRFYNRLAYMKDKNECEAAIARLKNGS